MGFTAVPAAGAPLRASVLATLFSERTPITAMKASNTARSNDATRTADPELTVALAASTTYEITVVLLLTSAANAAGDFTCELAFPAGATVSAGGQGLDVGLASGVTSSFTAGTASSADITSPTSNIEFGCSTQRTEAVLRARVATSTAGSVTVNWGQAVSNGNATTVNIGSRITATKVD